jgi:hypothetical protein
MSVSISGDGSVTGIDQGFNIVGILTASSGLVVAAGTTAVPSISPSGDSNTGIFFPSADTIAFTEGGVEALRITSTSRVGLGTNIPDSYDSGARTLVIDESGSLAGMTIRSSTQGAVYFADGLTGNEAYRGRIEYSHSTDALNFGTAGTGSKLSLTSGGDVQIANGNLVFSTSGKGIDFSATSNSSGTMTSELLSDYEEGTWTATVTCASTGSVTLLDNQGTYTRVGNICYVGAWIRVNGSTTGSAAGTITIGGFPFTASNQAGYRGRIFLSGYAFASITNATWGWIIVENGASSFQAGYGVSAWNTVTAFDGTNIRSTNAEFYINGFYKVA